MWMLALVLAGCGDSCPELVSLLEADARCDEAGWHIEAITDGHATDAQVRIIKTGSDPDPVLWLEEHPLPLYAIEPGTCEEALLLDLSLVDEPDQVVIGSHSYFQCSELMWLTFEVSITADTGEECVVWGHFPDDIGGDHCRRLE